MYTVADQITDWTRRCKAIDMTDPNRSRRCSNDWTVDLGKMGKVCDRHAKAIKAGTGF